MAASCTASSSRHMQHTIVRCKRLTASSCRCPMPASSRSMVLQLAARRHLAPQQRRMSCRAEEGDGDQSQPSELQKQVADQLDKATPPEAATEGNKALGLVGNIIMWTLLSVMLAASLFFTTARSFLPNDMQPLQEDVASQMR